MTEYEKEQLELLKAQNKRLEIIRFNQIWIIALLTTIVVALVLLYTKKDKKYEIKTSQMQM